MEREIPLYLGKEHRESIETTGERKAYHISAKLYMALLGRLVATSVQSKAFPPGVCSLKLYTITSTATLGVGKGSDKDVLILEDYSDDLYLTGSKYVFN